MGLPVMFVQRECAQIMIFTQPRSRPSARPSPCNAKSLENAIKPTGWPLGAAICSRNGIYHVTKDLPVLIQPFSGDNKRLLHS